MFQFKHVKTTQSSWCSVLLLPQESLGGDTTFDHHSDPPYQGVQVGKVSGYEIRVRILGYESYFL